MNSAIAATPGNAIRSMLDRGQRRLGFKFEGVWRQANVHKGRSRDTAWFSILDSEWPAIKIAFEHWLAPENFDAGGRQVSRLSSSPPQLMAGLREGFEMRHESENRLDSMMDAAIDQAIAGGQEKDLESAAITLFLKGRDDVELASF